MYNLEKITRQLPETLPSHSILLSPCGFYLAGNQSRYPTAFFLPLVLHGVLKLLRIIRNEKNMVLCTHLQILHTDTHLFIKQCIHWNCFICLCSFVSSCSVFSVFFFSYFIIMFKFLAHIFTCFCFFQGTDCAPLPMFLETPLERV